MQQPTSQTGNSGLPPQAHTHCWHVFRGPLLMVVPDGHVVQKCCGCATTRVIHADHAKQP